MLYVDTISKIGKGIKLLRDVLPDVMSDSFNAMMLVLLFGNKAIIIDMIDKVYTGSIQTTPSRNLSNSCIAR